MGVLSDYMCARRDCQEAYGRLRAAETRRDAAQALLFAAMRARGVRHAVWGDTVLTIDDNVDVYVWDAAYDSDLAPHSPAPEPQAVS